MKKIIMFALAGVFVAGLTGCSKVGPGEVGVRINNFGSDKGIVEEELTQGVHFHGPRATVEMFPTYKQSYKWTKGKTDGDSENDEAIYFNSNDGMAIDVDLGITYQIMPSKANEIFAEYRMGVNEITDQYMRKRAARFVNDLSSEYSCEDIYGEKKGEFFMRVETNMIAWGETKGFIIESVSLIGRPRLPGQVEQSINAKIAATQKAQMRENEIAESEAAKKIAANQSDAKAYEYKAMEDAKIAIMEEQARVLRENPQLMNWKAVETWDGVMPKYMGGDSPMPFIDVTTK